MKKSSLFKQAVCLLSLLIATLSTYAQIKVTGVVTDSNGEPLAGVTVVVKGANTGTTTMFNGSFSLNVAKTSGTVLVFSFIGYEQNSVALTESNPLISITMQELSIKLDDVEVVAIGYGTARRKDLTGSISSIKGEILESIPTPSVAEALTGRMAGVNVTTTEGSPDAEVKIRVRGGGSITQDNSPLYVVDGFPVSSITDIASSEIATIDVLKDASSTAIYGARGANGVILITTKSGKDAKVAVNFNTYLGWQKLTKELDVLAPYEYLLFQYEATGLNNRTPQSSFTQYYGAYADLEANYKGRAGNNWQEKIFGNQGFTQNYNLSVSGGDKKTKYNVSLSRIDKKGVMIGTGSERTNGSAKLNGRISDKVTFDFQSRLSYTITTGTGTSTESSSSSSRLRNIIKYPPIGRQIIDPDADEYYDDPSVTGVYNPADVSRDDYRKQYEFALKNAAALNWTVVKNLVFRTEAGWDYGANNSDRFYGPSTSQARNSKGLPLVTVAHTRNQGWRVANTLYYKTKITGKDKLDLLIGQEALSTLSRSTSSRVIDFPADMTARDALANLGHGSAASTTSMINSPNRLSSFFGRANYNYLDRYLVTATFRADGSSRFAKGNRWGYFPSAAFAWRISEESFMKGKASWIDNLKLYLRYGTAGNNRIPADLWKLQYEAGQANRVYSMDEIPQITLVPNEFLTNPHLKWETTRSANVGIDWEIFYGRLSLTAEAYHDVTQDLLIRSSIPSNTGYRYQYQNIGSTSKQGLEFTLNGHILQKRNLTLSAAFNISFNRNKILDLGGMESWEESSGWYGTGGPGNDYLVMKGKPVGLMYGYVTDGVYSFDNFIYNTATSSWVLKEGVPDNSGLLNSRFFGPGSVKFKKTANDGEITIGDADRVVIGNANPKHTGGLTLYGACYGFDFSVFANWVYGNNIYNANKLEFSQTDDFRMYTNKLSFMNSSNRFMLIDMETGEWLTRNPERLEEVNRSATMWHGNFGRIPLHSWAIEDGSFLRLNQVTIGYTLPSTITRKAFIRTLRIYATGYNLAIWSSYTGYDPEVDTRRGTPLTPGVDYAAYPRSRTFVFGANITF